MNMISGLLLLGMTLGIQVHAETAPLAFCPTIREFVTTLEFLRSDSDFKPMETEARELAFQVATGCEGAAQRFIRVAKVLMASGSNRRDAGRTGLDFARGSDPEADAFTTVFRIAIAEDSLDLDFKSSLRLALSLSKEFPGDLKRAREDFENVVQYCSDARTLGLSRMQCGDLGARIARTGVLSSQAAGKSFIDSFEFLKSPGGPALITGDALTLAIQLAEVGAEAHQNFNQAYEYALSRQGLALGREEAVKFARKISLLRRQEPKTPEPKKDPERTNSEKGPAGT